MTMKDLDKTKKFLDEMGISYEEINGPAGHVLRCTSGHSHVGGYVGFFADFEFDFAGKFLELALME